MSLLRFRNLHLAFGRTPLLEDASDAVVAGERICLLGRNGSGKSSLLRLLAGEQPADSGELVRSTGLRIGWLPQEVPSDLAGTVREIVADGLGEARVLLERHAELSHKARDAAALEQLEAVHARLDALQGWDIEPRVDATLERLRLDPERRFGELSGGTQRRVLLARALVATPDLLLLDEPTNHLDVRSIEWLEGLLSAWRGALLFTTHDRRLLRALATRIWELDRGTLTSWPGDYDDYLRRRAERDNAEATDQARRDALLAQEEVWIRQGIEARRTRNEGRVRRLEAMRLERAARRERTGNARLALQRSDGSGKLVFECSELGFAFGEQPIVAGFSTRIERGDRVGILGPNGVGKTTLLRLLLGELTPATGTVRLGTRVAIGYFDQHRSVALESQRVQDVVADGRDTVTLDGQPRHVLGYLQDFLFTPDRARTPVSVLSGGERARLMLARLFAQPANVLVLDEPTNDLDIETLELLEEKLLEFDGTLLLISHDREFLDRVVTQTLAFDEDGVLREYVGGYSDWLRQRPTLAIAASSPVRVATSEPVAPASKPAAARRKQSYAEQRELAGLPERIEALEARIAQLQQDSAAPATYRDGRGELVARELKETEDALAQAYARWEALL